MQPVYVSRVFRILRILSVSQQAVAAHLGVSKTRVSLWANEDPSKVEPIARKHVRPFLRYTRDLLRSAVPSATADTKSQLWDAIETWAEEYAEQSGANNHEITRWKQVITESLQTAPEKETLDDQLRVYSACKALQLAYRHKRRHLGGNEALDAVDGIRRWGPYHSPDEDPVSRFEDIAGYWGVSLGDHAA
jgi:transcriptional regulator with XRE-family HTH domain